MTKGTDPLNVQRMLGKKKRKQKKKHHIVLKFERGRVGAKVKGDRDGEETADWGQKVTGRLCLSICNTNVGVMKWALAFTV